MNKKMSLALVSLLSLSFISCSNSKEEYYEIEKGLYVNALPGFYDEGFDLKFKLVLCTRLNACI